MSEEFITVKHSFNSGDLISILCGLRNIYETTGRKTVFLQQLNLPAYYYDDCPPHPVQHEGQNVCMSQKMWDMMRPLLLRQDYIERCAVWEGENVHIDFSVSRDRKSIPMPAADIHHWPFFIAPELACDLSIRWLKTEDFHEDRYKYSDKIIVNKTARYPNLHISYYYLKQYEKDLIFAGTDDEYGDFCKKYKLDFPKLECKDFDELAMHVDNCRGIIGNQSFVWHIADALKQNRILEFCPAYPNTFPTGANGYAALYQHALEFYTHKLLTQ